jgi:hypothetical protein
MCTFCHVQRACLALRQLLFIGRSIIRPHEMTPEHSKNRSQFCSEDVLSQNLLAVLLALYNCGLQVCSPACIHQMLRFLLLLWLIRDPEQQVWQFSKSPVKNRDF